MRIDLFEEFYKTKQLPDADLLLGKSILEDAKNMLSDQIDFDTISISELKCIIASFHQQKRANIPTFVALMRYFRLIKRNDLFILLTQYTGGIDVVENIIKRAKQNGIEEKAILGDLTIPPLGSSPEELSNFTSQFIQNLQTKFDEQTIKFILSGNNHGIPKEAFANEIKFYQEAKCFTSYLQDLHERKIKELQQHLNRKTVWFEQEVTEEMIAFVRSNQEILSGVLENDILYQTKIPYDTSKYLAAKTKEERAYYACHCPFAREALKRNRDNISPLWCYCSAGFEKVLFEVLFDQTLSVTCLNSVLNGDDYCRFAIDLSQVNYKR